MSDEPDAVTALFSAYRGDGWHLRFTAPQIDGVDYDADTLLAQVRSTAGTLIASTGAAGADDDVIQIDDTGTDFESDPMVLELSITEPSTGVNPDDSYVIEAQCEVNGRVLTFLHHDWVVARDYAYEDA
jgi:hypothetical protein